MANASLALKKRSATGTTAAKALRRSGQIPGTLYGHGSPALDISIEEKALFELLRRGEGHHLIEITVDGGSKDTALVRGLQRDPISRSLLHADLQRVSSTESIRASVTITLVGTAPGVKDQGGVLDFTLHQIEISGPAASLPQSIEHDISGLNLRDHVTASQIVLPNGFTLVTPPDAIVASVEASRTSAAVEEVAPAAAAPAAAAPAAS